VHVIWQLFAFVILTAAEVMVSITALEFSYTQAPNSLKSLIMGLFLLSVSLGNLITALVNKIIVNADGTLMLDGAEYFWFFTVLMFVTSLIFIFVARLYKPKTYIQSGRDTLEDIVVEE
jgi:POT family proton-dependent oligopeptide transporter